MNFLFCLMLLSSIAFSLALFFKGSIDNPLWFVMIGWAPVVIAYYVSMFMDYSRLFILNRNYEAYIVNSDGTYWDGRAWVKSGPPKLYYNNFQVDGVLKKLHHQFGFEGDELYVKVILPESFFERMQEDEEGEDE